MVPQNMNMSDILKSVRLYAVQKNGELFEKFEENLNLVCEYSSQGLNMKILRGILEALATYTYVYFSHINY